MKPTSPEYKQQINKLGRNRSYIKILFLKIDVSASEDGESVDNGHEFWSEWESPDTEALPEEVYATWEPDRWLLDGSMKILPETAPYEQEGFIGNELSDENGYFTVNPIITREFSAKHSLLGLTISFDRVANEGAKHIKVTYYSNGDIIEEVEMQGDLGSLVAVDLPSIEVDKYQIEILRYTPRRRARIQRVIHGFEVTFNSQDVEFTTQTQDVDPLSRRLPTETLEFTIFDFDGQYDPDNPSSFWEFIDIQSPISIQHGYELDDGSIEWLSWDRYLLNGRPVVSDNRATFSAKKLLGHLEGIYYKGKTGLINLYDLAEDVFIDANLTKVLGQDPWKIDESLKDVYTTNALPIDTHKNCLQIIAHAGQCKLYTDNTGFIKLEKMVVPVTPEDINIDFGASYHKPDVTKIQPLYSINVLKTTNSVSPSTTELHKSMFSVNGEGFFYAEFNPSEDVNITCTGGTLDDIEIYTRAVTAKITAVGEVTITVTGKQITSSASGLPLFVSTDNRGGEEVVENPLVTSNEVKEDLENFISDYLQLRNTYSLQYRGRPDVEAGDLIKLQSQFTPEFPALVLKHVINFNGALSGEGIFKKTDT